MGKSAASRKSFESRTFRPRALTFRIVSWFEKSLASFLYVWRVSCISCGSRESSPSIVHGCYVDIKSHQRLARPSGRDLFTPERDSTRIVVSTAAADYPTVWHRREGSPSSSATRSAPSDSSVITPRRCHRCYLSSALTLFQSSGPTSGEPCEHTAREEARMYLASDQNRWTRDAAPSPRPFLSTLKREVELQGPTRTRGHHKRVAIFFFLVQSRLEVSKKTRSRSYNGKQNQRSRSVSIASIRGVLTSARLTNDPRKYRMCTLAIFTHKRAHGQDRLRRFLSTNLNDGARTLYASWLHQRCQTTLYSWSPVSIATWRQLVGWLVPTSVDQLLAREETRDLLPVSGTTLRSLHRGRERGKETNRAQKRVECGWCRDGGAVVCAGAESRDASAKVRG